MTWREQYQQAHRDWFFRTHKDPHPDAYYRADYPQVKKANGLTLMIQNFLQWKGHRATRINTQGQYVQQKHNGKVIMSGYRPSQTRKGTSDISATINGKSVMLEIKAGRDKPSEAQLKEQQLERSAGGIYEFIYSAEQFFEWYRMNVEMWK